MTSLDRLRAAFKTNETSPSVPEWEEGNFPFGGSLEDFSDQVLGWSIDCNGLHGGDNGQGGYATIQFQPNDGYVCAEVEGLYDDNTNQFSSVNDIKLTFHGDWEITSLYVALVGMAEQLKDQIKSNSLDEGYKVNEWRNLE